MSDLWKKALEAQRAHNKAVHEATKIFNRTKRETGKEDQDTFEGSIAPTWEAYDKAYADAKRGDNK